MYRENSSAVTVNRNFAFGFRGAKFSPTDLLWDVFSSSKNLHCLFYLPFFFFSLMVESRFKNKLLITVQLFRRITLHFHNLVYYVYFYLSSFFLVSLYPFP